MKSTLISKLSLALLVAAFFTSCQKEMTKETTDLNLPTKSGMTANEEAFIQNLQRSISSPNNKAEMRSDDVANPNNPLDEVGLITVEAMKYAISQEDQTSPTELPDYSRLNANYQSYFSQNFGSTVVLVELSTEFQNVLQSLLKSSFLQEDAQESTADIKIIEQALLDANFLNEAQKNSHLVYSSSLRYMKEFLESYTSSTVGNPNPNATWDGFEQDYASCLNSSLMSWDTQPLETAANWLGSGYTIMWCMGDSAWNNFF